MQKNNNEGKKSSPILVLLLLLGIALVVGGAVYTGYYLYSRYDAQQRGQELESIAQTTVGYDGSLKNPIDFKSLQKKNDEIYSWLKIPGTNIDYPIVQSKTDDMFYLNHSATDRAFSKPGAIYTESSNTTTFEDRVTVIYGHNGYKDIMFTDLHKFENKSFFDKHDIFYIYTPDSKLTYKIVSAFKYDNRHIMNSMNFQINDVFEQFLLTVQNPASTNKNVRQNLDKSLTIDDNIVVLSTCIQHQASNRYLVCGVLIKNEKTN